MKDKQIACILLIIAVMACVFGIMQMQNQLAAARKAANNAKESAEASKSQRVRAAKNLDDLRAKSQDKLAYYDQWKPNFQVPSNAIEVEAELDKLFADLRMSPLSRRGESSRQTKDDLISEVYRVHMSFVESYPKLFNWLARMEGQLKNSRITRLNVKKAQSENELAMEVSLEIPLVAGLDPNAP